MAISRQYHDNPLDVFTLTVRETSRTFGFATQTIYNMINTGRLIRGYHYLKIGKKLLIKREQFIEWLEEQDGSR